MAGWHLRSATPVPGPEQPPNNLSFVSGIFLLAVVQRERMGRSTARPEAKGHGSFRRLGLDAWWQSVVVVVGGRC